MMNHNLFLGRKLYLFCVISLFLASSCKKNEEQQLIEKGSGGVLQVNAQTPVYNPLKPTKATIIESPSTTINVSGISNQVQINNAINSISSQGGGTVLLGSGIFRISAPIVLKSNVRLKGVGEDVTIIKRDESWNPTSTSIGMVQSNGYIEDVTVSDLTIDGNRPSSYRMSNDFRLFGLLITADGTTSDHNNRVYITTIKIINCGMGCHVKHTNDVIIKGCYIVGNGTKGGGDHDSPHYFHNVYVRNIDKAWIYGTNYFKDSPAGNGLNTTHMTNLTVEDNIITGNNFRGVRIGGSASVVLVRNNTISSNDDFGLGLAYDETGQPTKFSFIDNTLDNNHNYGIYVANNSKDGQVRGNQLSSNSPGNIFKGSNLTNVDVQ